MKFKLLNIKFTNYPIREGLDLIPNKKQASDEKIKKYQIMVGLVIFVIIKIYPNITFAVSIVNYFIKNLNKSYMEAAKHII